MILVTTSKSPQIRRSDSQFFLSPNRLGIIAIDRRYVDAAAKPADPWNRINYLFFPGIVAKVGTPLQHHVFSWTFTQTLLRQTEQMSVALAAPLLLPRPSQSEASHFPHRSAHAPPATCSDCVHCHDIDSSLKVFDEMSEPEGCGVDEVTYGRKLSGDRCSSHTKCVIDQDLDPNATIVEITFGDRLGALLDTMNALKNLGLNVIEAQVYLDSSGKHKFAITKT
ncbi:act domain-containing protein acr11 [Phtheirospermum japonicum]|uniref:Act domain-containing protein acr11 n=1 Tax=Phtheirospermum japonicum TaxID=374723 RepID=A0A830DAW1_9LAMI|nr:act domain-containing protein acr11 [Phtheirospermum japonicum]